MIICKRICKSISGEISITSSTAGNQYHITVEISKMTTTKISAKLSHQGTQEYKHNEANKILLVDDTAFNNEVTKMMLNKMKL